MIAGSPLFPNYFKQFNFLRKIIKHQLYNQIPYDINTKTNHQNELDRPEERVDQ